MRSEMPGGAAAHVERSTSSRSPQIGDIISTRSWQASLQLKRPPPPPAGRPGAGTGGGGGGGGGGAGGGPVAHTAKGIIWRSVSWQPVWIAAAPVARAVPVQQPTTLAKLPVSRLLQSQQFWMQYETAASWSAVHGSAGGSGGGDGGGRGGGGGTMMYTSSHAPGVVQQAPASWETNSSATAGVQITTPLEYLGRSTGSLNSPSVSCSQAPPLVWIGGGFCAFPGRSASSARPARIASAGGGLSLHG